MYSLHPQVISSVTPIPVLGVTFFSFLLYIFWAIATLANWFLRKEGSILSLQSILTTTRVIFSYKNDLWLSALQLYSLASSFLHFLLYKWIAGQALGALLAVLCLWSKSKGSIMDFLWLKLNFVHFWVCVFYTINNQHP